MSDTSHGDDAPHGDDGGQPPTVIQLPGGASVSVGHGGSFDGTINGVPMQVGPVGVPAAGELGQVETPVAVHGQVEIEGQIEVHGTGLIAHPPPGSGLFQYDDDITIQAGGAGDGGPRGRGGNVILSGGRGSEGEEDGRVIVEGDLHVTGDVVRLQDVTTVSIAATPPSPLYLSVAAPEPRELMRIGADGEVEFGEPITKDELTAMLGRQGSLHGFMDGTSMVLSVVVSELIRVRQELERLRSRVE